VLIGPRGAGKSSVGPLLARAVGLPFFDADDEVERAAGERVAVLFESGRFRAEEARVLGRLLAGPPAVVAAGGGCVLWEGFRAAVRGWTVAWLDAEAPALAARLRDDPRPRPSLTGFPLHEEIARVREARAPLYAAIAAARFDTTGLSPAEVATRIARSLLLPPRRKPPK
jgi:shikimate kinase